MNKKIYNFVDDITDFSCKAVELLKSDCEYDIFDAIKDIKGNLLGWVKSGLLLGAIKSSFCFTVLRNKLAKNWEEFCIKFFEQSHWYSDRLIKASRVVLILIENGFSILPKCEAQARPLVKFLPDPEYRDYENEYLEKELCDKWKQVLQATKDKPITAGVVLAVVDPEKAEAGTTTIRLSKKAKQNLLEIALQAGYTTISEYLENLHQDEQETQASDQDKEQAWEKDLQDLLQEREQEIEKKYKGFGEQTTKQVVKKIKSPQVKSVQNNNFVQNLTQDSGDMVTGIINTATKIINPLSQTNLNTT